MTFVCESQDDVDSWKASFLHAGVNRERNSTIRTTGKGEIGSCDLGLVDPILEMQVDTIRNQMSNYMKIVTKTCKDLVPKIIVNIIINETKKFINGELLSNLCTTGETVGLHTFNIKSF